MLRESVSTLKTNFDKLAGLKAFQAANVANGEPTEVPMTDEEIANPEGISFDRLALSGQKAQAKIKELNKAGQVGTRKGAADILAALGCDVAPAKAERKRNA